MPDRVIPCVRCAEMKDFLENEGVWEVVSCKPIKYRSGKCKIIYRVKQTSS
jgi:hypothetical protein